MKAYIDVPDKLSDIKLRQYQKFVQETKDNEDTDFIQNKIIEIFCNVRASDVKKIKYTDIKKISNRINKLFEEKPALVRNFNLYGVNYYFIPNLDDISLGEYIDIDTYISEWDNIHIAMNVLYRPLKQKLKEKYLIEDYNENNNTVLQDMPLDAVNTVLQDMPLDAVMSSIFFFYHLGNDLLKVIVNYLQNNQEIQQALDQTSVKSGDGITVSMLSLKETLRNLKKLLD
jgi:hypothetical protein